MLGVLCSLSAFCPQGLAPRLLESHGSRWLLEAQPSNPHSSPKAGGRKNRLKDLAPSSVHVLRSYSRNFSRQIPLVSHSQSCVAQLAVRAAALLATSPPLNTEILLLWKKGQYRASLVTLVKNPLGSIPDLGISHVPWSNEDSASQLLSLCSRTQEQNC